MFDLILAIIFLVGLYHSFIFLYRLFVKKKIAGITTGDTELEEVINDLKAALATSSLRERITQLVTKYETRLHPAAETTQHQASVSATSPATPPAPVEDVTPPPVTRTEAIRPAPKPTVQQPQNDSFGEWYKDNSINLLMYLGAFLIVMAAIAFLGFTWDIMSGGMRFVSLLAFTGAFAAAGFGFYNNKKVRQAGVTFIGISALLLPINGTAFQMFVMPHDASPGITWLISSAICMMYYIYIFKLMPNRFYAIIIHLSSLSLVSSFVNIAKGNPEWYIFAALIDSYILYFANMRFLKGIAGDIRKLTDQSSHIILIISMLFGFVYSVEKDILFTWSSFVAVMLTAGYYLLRYHFGERYGFLVSLLAMYVGSWIGMGAGQLDPVVRSYIAAFIPFLFFGVAHLFRTKEYEAVIARRVSLGTFWVALLYAHGVAIDTTNSLFTPHTTILLLLSALFHTLHFREFRLLPLFIVSHISFFAALVWAIATWQPEPTIGIVVYFAWFLIAILAGSLVNTNHQENRWNMYLTIGYSGLITLFYFGMFIETEGMKSTGMAVLLLGNALLHGYLFTIWNRHFGFTALLLQYLVLVHFCWWQGFSIIPSYLILYGLTSLQMLLVKWLELKQFIKQDHRYIFIAPLISTVITQVSAFQYASDRVPQVSLSLFLSALFAGITYATWHRYAYSVIHACIAMGLFALAYYLELTPLWVLFVLGMWSTVLLLGFRIIRERFPERTHEAVSTIIGSSVYSFILMNYLTARWSPDRDVFAVTGWTFFMAASYALSRYQAYLYIFFTMGLFSVGMIHEQYVIRWLPEAHLLSLLFAAMAAATGFAMRFRLPKYPLVFGSGLYLIASYISAIHDMGKSIAAPMITLLLNLPITLMLAREWQWYWPRFCVLAAAYMPVFGITAFFAIPEWAPLGLVLSATGQYFAAPWVDKTLYPGFRMRMERISMGVASIMTFLDSSKTLGSTDLSATLNCASAALSTGLVTEYWRKYKPAGMEYLVPALWILVLLRIFNRMSIEEAQFYVQPIAFYLTGIGIYHQIKKRSNAQLFQYAGIAFSIIPLFFSSFGLDGFWYAATLFAEGIVLIALGINMNLRTIRTGGIAALALGTFAQTAQYLFNIPWWVWLGITGIGLLAAGTVLLSKKK